MSGTTLSATSLPFREAIAYFRGKTNTPTQHWTDVWRTAHARSFMVAGAASDALLNDFRTEITKALEQGTTLQEFRRGFDAIVARHGWVHNGTPGWRSRIIYETNLSMAYAAGRYAQMTEPDTLAVFPYWQYVHSRAQHPRRQHQLWDGLVLRADDPFWRTNYPPNGWRCGCRVRPVSGRGLERMGRDGPDPSPRLTYRSWTNPRTGQMSQVVDGIDPGFDYNPGEAWQGPPQIPGDAVLRPPPRDWPPAVPGGAPIEPGSATRAAAQAIRDFLDRPRDMVDVGPLAPSARARLGAAADRVVMSAETLHKQRLHHPDLTPDDYAVLPELLEAADIILEQGNRRVLLIRQYGRMYVAAVKVTEDGREAFLLSFRRSNTADLHRMLARYPPLPHVEE